MHISFEITRMSDDLTRKTWAFVLYQCTFVLSEYREEYKMNPLAGWRVRRNYDRIVKAENSIEAEQIEIPDDVEAELLETFIGKLIVTKWN